MKEMADAMLDHRITRTGRCSCGDVLLDMSPERVAAHVAAALTAAGFGRVSEPITSVRDLVGIAPDWTDGMGSVEWVRAQRDRA